MQINNQTILAIAPGTREIGWAVLQADSLLHCGVRTITKRHDLKVARLESSRFIESLINRYEPHCMAIEKRFLAQKSSSILTTVAEEAKQVAKRSELEVSEYVSTGVRQRLCQNEKATKKNISRLLARRYPELQHYLRYENKWSELYYTKMFDAVAVAVICYQDLAKTRSEQTDW